ncbi:aldolase [Sistotremastrum suecicum HHB10207 ss-3]|uniref:Aldolase n=1 Tax=Sistotremastrum suecicum HHB10207 ss-3 TaxID=1314776 RepID=A0A166CZL5_9AGAM|nr:aldolase [Sistotremastrum suecicum HHB10207 ss-3]
MTTNGHSHTNGTGVVRPLTPGIYAPIPTFFVPDSEDLDIPSFEAHVTRVGLAGVGILVCGSMGEAPHLSHEERVILIKAARRALDKAGLHHAPIVAGTGSHSLRETLHLTRAAAQAGADYSIVICSGYFAGAIANDKQALKAFWSEVAAKSPIPVIIYNYPAACGGIDLDSDTIEELAQENPNLCGVKLTCGNVGKLTRIAATVSVPSFDKSYPRQNPNAPFLVLGGYTDFIVPSAFARAHGAITGLANVAPHACARLHELSQAAVSDLTLLPAAQALQDVIARADRTMALASISGTKATLERLYGYGGLPRKPLPPFPKEKADILWAHPNVVELVRVERELSGKIASK